jgi:hypothetical protein
MGSCFTMMYVYRHLEYGVLKYYLLLVAGTLGKQGNGFGTATVPVERR